MASHSSQRSCNKHTARTAIYEGDLAKDKARMELVGPLRCCGPRKGRNLYRKSKDPGLFMLSEFPRIRSRGNLPLWRDV